MVKLYRIPGTDVKIRISQDSDLWLRVGFDDNGVMALAHVLHPLKSAESIRALGFPTEDVPIDGGDLEEVTE